MPRPTVSASAEELYSRLGPWRDRADEAGAADDRWDLLEMCEAIMTGLQPVEDIIRDQGDLPGYSQIGDPDRTPSEWLAWTGQLFGVRLRDGLDDAAQRARIKSTDGFKRGSPSAIVAAAQQYLTGTKTVYLIERHGSAYQMTVATLTAETPDPDAVSRAVLAQKPAGIVMAVTLVVDGTYNSLRDTHASYDVVEATFDSYNEIVANPTKT